MKVNLEPVDVMDGTGKVGVKVPQFSFSRLAGLCLDDYAFFNNPDFIQVCFCVFQEQT